MRTPVFYLLALSAVITLAVAGGCAEDGVTSNCPALPLYDVNAAAGAPDLSDAIAKNCVTPVGHAVSPGSGSGTSGSSGSGGSGGTSGSGGSGG